MKKKAILTSVLALFGTMAFAQATLPSTENFNSFTGVFGQAGWTYVENPAGTPNYSYATGGVSGTAMGRLDETMDYIEVFTGGQMGTTTYWLRGSNSGGAWQGTFNVLESVNGSTWTNLATYTTASPMATTLTQYTVTPASASRYIRWEFTAKVSGHNVAIDDVNITAGVALVQDINVKYNTTSVLTGGTTPIFGAPVGTPTPLNFSVENTGLATLGVTSVTFTGADAADFSVTSPVGAFSVNATSNQALVVSFNASAPGTRVADMIIANDDADEASYVIHLNAVGGTLATEPTGQASALAFSNIKSYRAAYSFTAASGSPDGYIVLRKTSSSPITDVPADGTWYQRGDMVGTSKVVSTSTDLNNTLMNVWAGKDYQLAVFAYNGSGSFTNYNTVNPALNGFTSLATMLPAGEYSSVSTASPSFLTQLQAKINPHTSIFYSNYANTMINLFEATDTINGQKTITCKYSGERVIYTPPFDWTNNDFSREHSYCHNWMPTNPADNPELPEYNDQHHLFPCKQTDVNAERSNYPLGEVINVQNVYLDGKSGLNALGQKVYEPRDEQKGNSARAIMYVAACYNGVSGNNWQFRNPISGTIAYGQDQEVLKAWHYMDPPDSYEIARNDFLDSLQGNRNPFIDSMQYACYIDFSNMTKITSVTIPCGSFVGVKENKASQLDFSVFPNPSAGTFSVLLNADLAGEYTVNVVDVTGRIIETQAVKAKLGNNYISFANKVLPAGAYAVEISSASSKTVKKLIVQ
ncbi:MAG: endonuclease [Bacteroidota bacterium]|nr:endonuclease [Bacteroidota bacterium]